MKCFEIAFGELQLDRRELFRTLGYPSPDRVDALVAEQLETVIVEIARICRPRFGYAIHFLSEPSGEEFALGDSTFAAGRIIVSCLEGADRVAVFVATAGEEFALWAEQEACKGDVFRDLLIDSVGSEIAEAAGRELMRRLVSHVETLRLRAGNAYSPGYCGWSVRDQRALFSLLPPSPCGIRLNDSCLMYPVKSISGVIPLGERVEKRPYGCAICDNKTCYKKRKR